MGLEETLFLSMALLVSSGLDILSSVPRTRDNSKDVTITLLLTINLLIRFFPNFVLQRLQKNLTFSSACVKVDTKLIAFLLTARHTYFARWRSNRTRYKSGYLAEYSICFIFISKTGQARIVGSLGVRSLRWWISTTSVRFNLENPRNFNFNLAIFQTSRSCLREI